MPLHLNPFYKSRFAKANDGFIERMWRALLNFAGSPTADNNNHAKYHGSRKDEAALGLFDYMTLFVPALIDKFKLILSQFIRDKNNKYTGFWFGCLKCLACFAIIPTFVLHASLTIARYLFGTVGMLFTFLIAAFATATKFEGIEANETQYTHPINRDTRLDNDPYINVSELEQIWESTNTQNNSLNQLPILPLNQDQIIPDNHEVSPNTNNDFPGKNPFAGLIKKNSSEPELMPMPLEEIEYQDIFQTNGKPPYTQNNTNTEVWCQLL